MTQARIVIVGAGFGGMQTAQSLAKSGAEVVLIDRQNYHTFVPLLYQVASGQLSPDMVVYPLRNLVRRSPNLRVLVDEVTHIDFHGQQVITPRQTLFYDYLVLATGCETTVPSQMQSSGSVFSLKTLPDAIALRNQILQCVDQGLQASDESTWRRLLSITIVGGGPTGVEVAGTLAELRQVLQRDYPQLQQRPLQIRLLHSGDRLLMNFSPALGQYTARKLRRMGIEVQLSTPVKRIDGDRLELDNGEVSESATIIWSAGLTACYPTTTQSLDKANKNKLVVRPTLQLPDHPNIYVIGDVAYVTQQGKPLTGVAPEALQQGVTVAHNLKQQLNGKSPHPFRYLNKGRLAIIGQFGAVGKIGFVPLTGFLPWLLWLSVHLVYLPGLRNRLFVLLSWLHAYLWGDRPLRLVLPPTRPSPEPSLKR